MMTFGNISKLAHAMEDLFYLLRDEKPQNVDYSVLTDLILECIDFLKVELEKLKNGEKKWRMNIPKTDALIYWKSKIDI